MVIKTNQTFYLIKENVGDDQTEAYKEYRRKWAENPRNHVVGDFPLHLDIELNPHCNLRCTMCFQSWMNIKPAFMGFDLFKKIIDEGAENGLCAIKLQYRGEPLLHPEIAKMIKYAKDKGVLEVMFNTNAFLLTKEKAKELIEAGLDKIICSIDGYTKEDYEKVRIRSNFDTVVSNIKGLQELKKEMGVSKPIVRVQTIKFPNIDIKKYIEFWDKIADHIATEDLMDFHKRNRNATVYKDYECEQLWQRLMILYNGDIHLCCCDYRQELKVGNAKTDSIKEIWKSDRLNRFRDLHINGESHKISICAECDMREHIIKELKEAKKSE